MTIFHGGGGIILLEYKNRTEERIQRSKLLNAYIVRYVGICYVKKYNTYLRGII